VAVVSDEYWEEVIPSLKFEMAISVDVQLKGDAGLDIILLLDPLQERKQLIALSKVALQRFGSQVLLALAENFLERRFGLRILENGITLAQIGLSAAMRTASSTHPVIYQPISFAYSGPTRLRKFARLSLAIPRPPTAGQEDVVRCPHKPASWPPPVSLTPGWVAKIGKTLVS
jgi:hypothetical protein